MSTMRHRDLVRILNKAGFFFHSTGRHDIYMNAAGKKIPIPVHRMVAPGTLRDIFKMLNA